MTGNSSQVNSDNKSAPYHEVMFSGKTKVQSTFQRCALVLAVFFFVTTSVFLGLFIYYYIKYDETSKEMTSTASPAAAICNTPDCVTTAALMTKKMNLTADPCEDFHEYACGRFNREVVIPQGKISAGVFTIINDENQLIMKSIITEDITPQQPQYVQNMKRLYQSCVNEGKIEDIGLQPFLNETEYVLDWPTLNSDWNGSAFNLNDVIERYERVYVEPLFIPTLSTDLANTSQNVLYLSDPKLGLSQDYYGRQRNDSIIMAYEEYLAKFAVVLGANRSVAEQDAKEIVDFEVELSKIMLPTKNKRELTKIYNPTVLSELSVMYPDIDIVRAARAVFGTVNVTLADDERIINMYPFYMGNLSLVLRNFSNRAIQNLFSFKYALDRVEGLTQRLREIKLDFDKVVRGKTEQSPRWQDCLSTASSVFSTGMSKEFVTRSFSEQAKSYMEEMIDNLKIAFRQMLAENTWMGEPTREAAYKKLAAMKQKIGYPDVNFTVADIEQIYENHTMLKDNYYANYRIISTLNRLEQYTSLRKPVDRTEWKMAPYEVNAYYSLTDNEIAFPAGILQSPFFSQTFQDPVNYGAIGMVIGHEITHGFDDQGSQFDANGNLANWWLKSDREVFLNRTQCIVDQVSGFHVDEINMNVNGKITVGECVADNGGLKESFRAYKEHINKRGDSPTLPGLGLTQEQIFFLAFSQLWCEKTTLENLRNQVTTGSHPPGKYRIIGPLQNSEDFANAYKCPLGSNMNPQKKCTVW